MDKKDDSNLYIGKGIESLEDFKEELDSLKFRISERIKEVSAIISNIKLGDKAADKDWDEARALLEEAETMREQFLVGMEDVSATADRLHSEGEKKLESAIWGPIDELTLKEQGNG